MRMAEFITTASKQIISEWEQFAREHIHAASGMDLDERRDHVAAMLRAIAQDLERGQTKREQARKAKGTEDARADETTAAASHGADRAASGYSPAEMLSEFRSLRASVLRLWSEAQDQFDRTHLEEVTRFNEAIDQLLAESIAQFGHDVESSKDLFLGVLGHDLRNPLGAMMMSASMMLTKEGPDWPHARTASRILSSGARMDSMIRDLLDFTRSRLGGGIPITRADMDMEELCRQTVDEITAFHPSCVVEVETSGSLRGRWDEARIAQVLSNLIGNAQQHGASGKPVKITVRGEQDLVVLSVNNQGPVIADHQRKNIFDPFRQLDSSDAGATSKHVRSAGLGLYIAQAIVSAHRGTLGVESTEARGTTFTLRLPRNAP